MSKQLCPECGQPLPAGSPDGMCSNCLLKLGLPEQAPDAATRVAGNDASAPAVEQTGARIGRYKLLEEIGEGGFGTVWMAEQQEPVRRRVALKIIKLGMDTKEVIARFEAERQALAMMDHPNIARVFDGGATENGRPYFVMELVKGVRITDYCDINRLSTEERLELFMKVCRAVQHAHQKGVIHRDLKPSNVLVTVQDDKPVPKVIDFGIAKATEQRLTDKTFFTRLNQIIGTPAYMSPEQAGLGSLDIDTRSDIYSLGVLLYELLTGRTPFSSEELMRGGFEEVLRIIRDKEPPKPSTRLSTLAQDELAVIAARRKSAPQKLDRLVRGELDWVVMKALEKDRTRRYETVNGLATDLRRYLGGEAVTAARPTVAYRFAKFARKNRIALATGSAFAAILIAGIVATAWQAVRATNSARESGEQRDKAQAAQKTADLNAVATRRELYVAQIRLAHQAWQEGNLEQAEKMLEATIPAAGEEDLRDFEWRYLRRLVRDESRLTFADADFKAPVLDSHGVSHPLTLAADGKTLIIATSNTFKWLDMESHRIARTFEVGTNAIQRFAAVMNPPGLLAYVTDRIHLLASTGDPLPDEAFAHAFGTAIALSSDGSLLAFAETNLALRVLDVRTGKQVGPALPFNKTNRVMSLAFSPDAKYLVCGTLDTKILILEMPGLKMLKMLTGHSAIVECLAFDQVGRQLASGANDSHIRIWRFPDGNPIAHLTGHQGAIGSLAFSPDGTRLASGGWDHTVRLWNLGRGGETTFLHGHRDSVKAILFSKDGAQLYTGSNDGTVKVWAVPSTESTNVLQHSRWVSHVAISPDGTLLAVEDWYAPATVLWDLPSRRRITNLVQHSSDFHSGKVVFSPDGRLLATGGQDEIAQVWNLSEKRMIFEFPKERNSASLAFHSSRPILAVANEDVRFWDFRDGKETSLLKNPPNHGIRAVVFSPNGEWIALTHRDGEVSIWSVTTGQRSSSFHPSEKEAFAVCFSHDSAFLASGGADYRVALYDMRRRLIAHLDGHTAFVFGLAFAPGDKSLVSASWDGTVRFWYVANGQLALTLAHDGGPITSVAFSPDGNLMATSGADGTVRLWPAVSWAESGANKANPKKIKSL